MSTYTPIATQTLGSAAASVTFSSIPQGYTDLVVVCNVRTDQSGSSGTPQNFSINYNSDTGSNYSTTTLYAITTAGTALSYRWSSQTEGRIGASAQTSAGYFAQTNVNIQNYSNSTTYKTGISRSGYQGQYGVEADVHLWRNTNAITSIILSAPGLNLAAGSTFSLYGIQVGNAAQKAQGGNIVTSDGTYVYHTFTSSGSFIPNAALTVDYLVVAGGGGAGSDGYNGYGAGGGGGGGMRSTVTATGGGGSLETALSLTAQAYTVIVGAGGAAGVGGANTATNGTNGSNSVFSTITSTGGGGGGGANTNTANVGSNGATGGGGGTANIAGTTAGGTGTANQGFGGGAGRNRDGVSSYINAGGGGGAGAVGTSGGNTQLGNGGAGVATSISGSSVTYAGGGGGGSFNLGLASGGAGGGGTGGEAIPATNPTAGSINTGGGGGGGNQTANPSAAGGSGIVIIRYAI